MSDKDFREMAAKIAVWLVSGDAGISSKTMAVLALGAADHVNFIRLDAPHDPSDFGRCYRLVKLIPQIREFFALISIKVPTFAGIICEWDSLCNLYERDFAKGKSQELYERIQSLRGDR